MVSENIYAKNIQNELKSKSYAQKIHWAFIAYESFHFDERRIWKVISFW